VGTEAAWVPLVITAATAAGTGYVTYEQARQQNAAVKRSKASARNAAIVQARQLTQAAAIERQKRIDESERIRGRLRVASAAADVGLGAYDALDQQATVDAFENIQIVDQNLSTQTARVESGLAADLTALSNRTQNSVLAAFMGGMQGASTGLSIVSAAQQVGRVRTKEGATA